MGGGPGQYWRRKPALKGQSCPRQGLDRAFPHTGTLQQPCRMKTAQLTGRPNIVGGGTPVWGRGPAAEDGRPDPRVVVGQGPPRVAAAKARRQST